MSAPLWFLLGVPCGLMLLLVYLAVSADLHDARREKHEGFINYAD